MTAKLYRITTAKHLWEWDDDDEYWNDIGIENINKFEVSSNNGLTWQQASTNLFTHNLNSGKPIFINNNYFIYHGVSAVLSQGDTILKSIDMQNWTNEGRLKYGLSSIHYYNICEIEGVLYGYDLHRNEIMRSLDGVTFTAMFALDFTPSNTVPLQLFKLNNKFYIVSAQHGIRELNMVTGTSTQVASMPIGNVGKIKVTVFNNTAVLLVTSFSRYYLYISSNASSWTSVPTAIPIYDFMQVRTVPSDDFEHFWVHNNELYLGIFDMIRKTSNLTTWTTHKDFADQGYSFYFYAPERQSIPSLEIDNVSILSTSSLETVLQSITALKLDNVSILSNSSLETVLQSITALTLNDLGISSTSFITAEISTFELKIVSNIDIHSNSSFITNLLSEKESIVLEGFVKINGTIVSNADVIAISVSNHSKVYSTQTGMDGKYSFNIPEGDYHIISVFKDSEENLYTSIAKAYQSVKR